jgi:DNA-binding XRE family transcriptional regulator
MENCYNLIMPFDRERFASFLNDRFFEYRGKTDLNWTDFARTIGITQQTIAAWKNGYLKRAPDQENQEKLISFFEEKHPEIYDVLGLRRPSSAGLSIDLGDPAFIKRVVGAANKLEAELTRRGISLDSPEGEEIAIRIFSESEFSHTATERGDN